MFIRSNRRKNKIYYYIVKSVRKEDKIRQKVILYLGSAEKVYNKFKSNNLISTQSLQAFVNKALLKIPRHNICVVIQETRELGIKGEFILEGKNN